MDATFDITDPDIETTGDYLMFTITDGDARIPATISGTALAVLDEHRTGDDRAAFLANKGRIREAAYEMRRRHPELNLIALSTMNF